MDSKSPLIRLRVYGKLKRMMHSYIDHKLNTTDRRLLMGLYFSRLKDFAEDDRRKNLSLL